MTGKPEITPLGSHLTTRENGATIERIFLKGQTLFHKTRRGLFVGSLACLILFVGSCGSQYNVNDVTLTISPAATTISKSGQVALVASVNNFCALCVPQINWSIAENNGNPCLWQAGHTPPPTGSCPGGTLQAQGVFPTSVIYFGPSTAGTYHVTGSQVVSWTSSVTGTSVITVSP